MPESISHIEKGLGRRPGFLGDGQGRRQGMTHRVPACAAVAILKLKRRHRRAIDKRRDGARHWTLLRDLTDATLWIERYDSPTWVEYVRQNQRVTQADAEIGEQVRALHSGPNPPVVHRMIERQTASLPQLTPSRTPTLADSLNDPARPA